MIDNPHRLAPAAPDEDTVFGACRPGYPADNPSADAVMTWINSMQEADITRVCCLLSTDDLDAYPVDILDRYRDAFDHVRHVPITDYSPLEADQFSREILPFLRAADIAGDRVVVHCSAGLGRTGQALTQWLRYGRLYELNDAIDTVRSMGRRPLEAPDVDRDTLAGVILLTDAYDTDLSEVAGRHLFRELERRLLTKFPEMRIERAKYWAPVTHPDWSHNLAQIHPQQTQFRLLCRHPPDAHRALSEGPAGSGFGDTYPSMFVVQSRDEIPTAVELIERYHTDSR